MAASYGNFGTFDESQHPELWRGCVGAWCPSLGPSGLRLYDHSGRSNHGALTSMDAATDWQVSDGRYALDFNAGGEHVLITPSFLTYPFSVSAWWYPTDLTKFSCVWSLSNLASPGDRWTVEMRNNSEGNVIAATAQSGAGGSYSQLNSTAACLANTWQHVCGVFRSATSRTIYLRGRNSATATANVTPINVNSSSIGRLATSFGAVLQCYGKVDSVMTYNRALSINEVALLASDRTVMYQRRRRQAYLFVGPTFNPAWASRSNTILQPFGSVA